MKRHRSDTPHIIDPDVLDAMLEATAPLVPPSGLRERVLAGVSANRQTLVTLHGDEAPWQALSLGVEFKLLWFDSQVRIKSFLLRAAAGSRFPRHGHQGLEECLVLKGECVIGAVRLRGGDFHSGLGKQCMRMHTLRTAS